MGIVQMSAVPAQPEKVVYVTPSLCRITTEYPVIAEPPSTGANQLVTTLVPEIAVVGAVGVAGTAATAVAIVVIATSLDQALNPTEFLD
jgi:hypothetical protein